MPRRYTDEEKQRALGMLAASWVASGGVVDVRGVSVSEGVPYHTVYSWWRRLSEERRTELATAATPVVQEAWRDGGEQWTGRMQDLLKRKYQEFMELDWKGERLLDRARTVETASRVLRDHSGTLGLVTGRGRAYDLESEMLERMAAAGMLDEGEE